MGGVAQLAREAGHASPVATPTSIPDERRAARGGDRMEEGWSPEQIERFRPDVWIVGNAVSRGNPLLEAILDRGPPYVSGPEWLAKEILQGRHVIAVAGTHGKTTTTSMVARILIEAGMDPGYLIGGVPQWSSRSAHLGIRTRPFVIEADEYDTAFCDKRSKFVHYRPARRF